MISPTNSSNKSVGVQLPLTHAIADGSTAPAPMSLVDRKAILTDNRGGRALERAAVLKGLGQKCQPPIVWDCMCYPDQGQQDHTPAETVASVDRALAARGSVFLLVIDVHYMNGGKFAGLEVVYDQLFRKYSTPPHAPPRWKHVAIFSAHRTQPSADSDRRRFEELLRQWMSADGRITTDGVFYSPDRSEIERFARWANKLH